MPVADEQAAENHPRADDIDLRPPGLIRFGLSRAIQVHSEEVRTKHPELHLSLDLVEDEQLLADDVVRVLYGVYLESLHNVLRHAQASRVEIRYHPAGDQMVLEIEDNGQGFEAPGDWLVFTRQRKLGLARLRRQVAGLGGKLQVVSAPGQGTRVTVRVPLGLDREPLQD
jgi:two-component system sensor histidine kinase UhpB